MHLFFIAAILLILVAADAQSDADRGAANRSISPWSSRIWETRPVRRDEPLREDNITDNEVREIEAVMRESWPGAVVYISAVTTGCPCEDGPGCTDQVWSVAFQGESSRELALSRIDGEWKIGPLQDWWLVRDRIVALIRSSRRADTDNKISPEEYLRRMHEHNLAFPACVATFENEEA